jgi:hypothetical protein
MNPQIEAMLETIRKMEHEIELELQRRREGLKVDFEARRVRFEQEVLAQQKRFKMGVLKYMLSSEIQSILSAPLIYAVFFPMLVLDLFVWVYQWVCFPLYGLARVERSGYFVFDRVHLGYLNIIEKINCAYCSYGNGLMAYAREVVGQTEQYWCPIKHARKVLHAHPYYMGFVDFGDAQAYRTELHVLRAKLASLKGDIQQDEVNPQKPPAP